MSYTPLDRFQGEGVLIGDKKVIRKKEVLYSMQIKNSNQFELNGINKVNNLEKFSLVSETNRTDLLSNKEISLLGTTNSGFFGNLGTTKTQTDFLVNAVATGGIPANKLLTANPVNNSLNKSHSPCMTSPYGHEEVKTVLDSSFRELKGGLINSI